MKGSGMSTRKPDCNTIWGAFRQIGMIIAYELPRPDEALNWKTNTWHMWRKLSGKDIRRLVMNEGELEPPEIEVLNFRIHECRKDHAVWWEWEKE